MRTVKILPRDEVPASERSIPWLRHYEQLGTVISELENGWVKVRIGLEVVWAPPSTFNDSVPTDKVRVFDGPSIPGWMVGNTYKVLHRTHRGVQVELSPGVDTTLAAKWTTPA